MSTNIMRSWDLSVFYGKCCFPVPVRIEAIEGTTVHIPIPEYTLDVDVPLKGKDAYKLAIFFGSLINTNLESWTRFLSQSVLC